MEMEQLMHFLLFIVLCIAAIDDLCTRHVHLVYIVGFFFGAIMEQILFPVMEWKVFVAGILFGVAIYVLSYIWKGVLGSGDAWMIALCGAYLGITQTMVLFFRAVLVAAVWGLGILCKHNIFGKYKKKTVELPFVPFMLCSYISLLVLGG
ncbi:MAG: prepilin peptidase [Lachnospiraceae bacterium]|nr:prepilin peptidase [Lachnospiraceae bacterium]